MNKEEKFFNSIVSSYLKKDKKISSGKMMSSPALKFNSKVFAFFYENQMCFRLGEEFDPKSFGVKKVKLLNPFKTKGPLK
jgi:hypothetical protein